MLIRKNNENGAGYVDQVQDAGNIDYVSNGVIYHNNPCKSVLIASESDLQNLTGYGPGTMAYTAGFKSMWQLSAGGEWIAI